jgi:hypothetical protein
MPGLYGSRMDILAAALGSLVIGVIAAVVLGNPFVLLIALIVGALFANRRGYRHQAQAMRREFVVEPPVTHLAMPVDGSGAPPSTGDRLAEVERLRAGGVITDGEAADLRKAILDSI